GKRLVVCSMRSAEDRQSAIRVYDVATGKEVSRFPLGSEALFHFMAVSPDGKVLGCGVSDRGCLFDLTTGKVRHWLTGRPWYIGFSPDGQT
ncbi:WD40 repeat domain-containing protein, partial [Escherichia coli]|uniref:WD40 repeat domain-containing protein n=1 Tax=Escherichia coli TaxID=562 RepID=UPI0028E09C9B